MSQFPCQPVGLEPNTQVRFSIVDITKASLIYFPFPFIFLAWGMLLHFYSGLLYLLLSLILQFVCLLRYTDQPSRKRSNNLVFTWLDPSIITEKIKDDLLPERVILATYSYPFISLLLGLVPKPSDSFYYIHYLFHPWGFSINDFILKKTSNLWYTSLKKKTDMVLEAGCHYVIIKKDINDAFHNIMVTLYMQ